MPSNYSSYNFEFSYGLSQVEQYRKQAEKDALVRYARKTSFTANSYGLRQKLGLTLQYWGTQLMGETQTI